MFICVYHYYLQLICTQSAKQTSIIGKNHPYKLFRHNSKFLFDILRDEGMNQINKKADIYLHPKMILSSTYRQAKSMHFMATI